jgi:hypothetical protein
VLLSALAISNMLGTSMTVSFRSVAAAGTRCETLTLSHDCHELRLKAMKNKTPGEGAEGVECWVDLPRR